MRPKKSLLGSLLAAFALSAFPLWAKKPPLLSITPDSPFFSPNKDGSRDQTVLTPSVANLKKISHWEVQVRDASSAVRRTLAGQKDPPGQVAWDGADEFGAPLAEGSYDVSLTVWNEDGDPFYSPPARVVIDLTPPTASLTSSSTTLQMKEGRVSPISFMLSAVDLSGILSWEATILDDGRRPVRAETSSAPLSSWTFDPEAARAGPGKYLAILAVTDRAGNRATSAPFSFEIVAPGADLPPSEAPAPIPSGKFLQLTSILSVADLFGSDATNQSSLLPQAAALLDPLAKSILDAPGSHAVILGHVDRRETPEEAKALSSYFAWRVFSHFVRQRGVDKNAVTVKGLGSDVPIGDNQSALGRSRNRRIEIQIFLPAPREGGTP